MDILALLKIMSLICLFYQYSHKLTLFPANMRLFIYVGPWQFIIKYVSIWHLFIQVKVAMSNSSKLEPMAGQAG